MFEAIQHNEKVLMEKGLDGIIQYAGTSIKFKQSIVMFYYRYLIHRYFVAWKLSHANNLCNLSYQEGVPDKTTISGETQRESRKINSDKIKLVSIIN